MYARGAGSLALVALLGGTLLGFSSPGPVLTDAACSGELVHNVSIFSGRADFGGDPHLAGRPRTSGRLCWGNGGAILEGQLYYDDLLTAGCAHVAVEFFNSNTPTRQRLSVFNQKVCSPGGLRQASIFSQVNGSQANAGQRVGRVSIQLFTSATANGARTSGESKTFTH